jgi:hypothetical protein
VIVKMRSLGLAILGAGMLAAATVLGAILVHDGEAEGMPLGAVEQGDSVALKGRPEPFFPPSLGQWAPVRPFLRENTYTLPAEDGVVALLTSTSPMPSDVVLAHGTVAFVGPHPTQAGVLLLVVDVQDWREPLLFR